MLSIAEIITCYKVKYAYKLGLSSCTGGSSRTLYNNNNTI